MLGADEVAAAAARQGPLLEIAERTAFTASLSVPTLEEKAWRATEPHTPHPRARLEAVEELNRLGIPTGVLIAPLMPGINDAPAQVEQIVELREEAGRRTIGGTGLHLRGEVRDVFFDWLRAKRPDLVERYEAALPAGAYLPRGARPARSRSVRPRRAATRAGGAGTAADPASGAAAPDSDQPAEHARLKPQGALAPAFCEPAVHCDPEGAIPRPAGGVA